MWQNAKFLVFGKVCENVDKTPFFNSIAEMWFFEVSDVKTAVLKSCPKSGVLGPLKMTLFDSLDLKNGGNGPVGVWRNFPRVPRFKESCDPLSGLKTGSDTTSAINILFSIWTPKKGLFSGF